VTAARRWSRLLLGAALVVKGLTWVGLVPSHAAILVLLGALVATGVAARASLLAASAFIWATMASGLYESHHFTLLGLLTLYQALSTRGPETPRPAELVMMAQVGAVYLWGGIWKINREFLSGAVVELEWSLSWLFGPAHAPAWIAVAASVLTVVAEVGCALALWWRRIPIRAVVATLAVLHAGMVLTVGPSWPITLELVAFALACGSTYPFFLAVRASAEPTAARPVGAASAP